MTFKVMYGLFALMHLFESMTILLNNFIHTLNPFKDATDVSLIDK